MDSDQSCQAQSSLPMGSTGSLSHSDAEWTYTEKLLFLEATNRPIVRFQAPKQRILYRELT